MDIPTIDDVAKAAQVSKSTVSRVLNGDYTYIREETRQRVQQAIEELGYRPNSVARSLTSKRTQTIAILVTDVCNPFYSDMIHGVENAANEKNYSVFLGNINYDQERGKMLVQSLIDRRVDGVLITSSATSEEWLNELVRSHVPTVVLDWNIQSAHDEVGIISVDFKTGIRQAVEHLWNLGHRTFAHVSGPLNLQTSHDRQDAFLEALANHGVPAQEVTLIESNFRIDGGRAAGEQLLKMPNRPTAVFAANDLTAHGMMAKFHERGLHVPQDLSVVGLDDIWLAAEMVPPLTTVSLHTYDIGTVAVKALFELLNRSKDQPGINQYTTQTDLVIRSSTSAPPRGYGSG
jgi:LacI family transcriptional regulator